MSVLLYIIGAAIIVFSFIAGISIGSFPQFIISVLGGFVSSIIFFALAKILDNQYTIIGKLDYQYAQDIKARNIEKKICKNCNKTYDVDYSSCPHCGHRD